MPDVNAIIEKFCSVADALIVYQAEAHPQGGWEAPDQPNQVTDAQTTAERVSTAKIFFENAGQLGHLAADGIENDSSNRFAGMPDRIFVVSGDKRIIYAQQPGPMGYQPKELEAFMVKTFSKA